MQLSKQQLEQFETDGYVLVPAVFSQAEIKRMKEACDRLLDLCINSTLALGEHNARLDVRNRAGQLNVRKVQPVNDASEYLEEVSRDERLLGPMRQIMLGHDPILMEEKLNYKQLIKQQIDFTHFNTGGRTPEDFFPLHHDWGYYRREGYPKNIVSSALTIDDSDLDNGPLRVVPGTHKLDIPTIDPDPASNNGRVEESLYGESERKPLVVPAGSVMFFHSMLLHDSVENHSGRPRRIMIYSHYPSNHQAEEDKRNCATRDKAREQEARYHQMLDSRQFVNQFCAKSECEAPGSAADLQSPVSESSALKTAT